MRHLDNKRRICLWCTIYHGSNVEVREPKILPPDRELDFGNRFYTTTNLDQAIAFARRVTRNRGIGAATVSVYEIDEKTATERFYTSRVYEELADEERKLWHYSPKVLFSLYKEETETGTITYPEEAF